MKPETLPAIWTLIQVIELGSLSAAAKKLGVTPSGVSKQVSRLEIQLGTRLLHRTTRRIKPTEEGVALCDRCHPLFDALNEAEEAVRTMRSSLSGHLRVTATPAFGRAKLVPAIGDFLGRNPELSIDVVLSAGHLDLIEGGIDLAIREGRLSDSTLIATKLGEFRIMLCASPGYLAGAGIPNRLTDLERHDFLTVPIPGREVDPGRIRLPDGSRLDLKPRIVVNDLFALRELARQDRGVVPLPDYMVEDDFAGGRLIQILPEQSWPAMAITGLVPERRFQPNRVRALLDFLVARFRNTSGPS